MGRHCKPAFALAILCAAALAACGSDSGGGGGGGGGGGDAPSDSALAKAAPFIDDATAGVYFVDWAALRKQLGATDLSSKDQAEKSEFFNGRLRKVSDIIPLRGPNLMTSADAVGFDAADFDWEASVQTTGPPVGVMGFPDDFDFAGVKSALKKCGYKQSDAGDVTLYSTSPVKSCGGPALANIAVVADEHVLVAGGSAGAVSAAAKSGDDAFESNLEDLDGALDDVVAGYVGTGKYGCEQVGAGRAPGGTLTPEIEKELKKRNGDLGPAYEVLMAGYVPRATATRGGWRWTTRRAARPRTRWTRARTRSRRLSRRRRTSPPRRPSS